MADAWGHKDFQLLAAEMCCDIGRANLSTHTVGTWALLDDVRGLSCFIDRRADSGFDRRRVANYAPALCVCNLYQVVDFLMSKCQVSGSGASP